MPSVMKNTMRSAHEQRMTHAVHALEEACVSKKPRAVEDTYREFFGALRSDGWAPEEELAQSVGVGVYCYLARGRHILQPVHFLRRTVSNHRKDAWRREKKHRALSFDEAGFEAPGFEGTGRANNGLEMRAAEESGVFCLEELCRPRPDLIAMRRQLDAFVDEYCELAAKRSESAERQVRAWALLRLENHSAHKVGELLGVNAQRATIYQWGTRGAKEVLRVAEGDGDLFRVGVMVRAVG